LAHPIENFSTDLAQSGLSRAPDRARISFVPGLTQNSGQMQSKRPMHLYEVRPRKDHRGFDLISDGLS
jgi:hypothetical protein